MRFGLFFWLKVKIGFQIKFWWNYYYKTKPMSSFNAQIVTNTNKLFVPKFSLCLYELFSKISYWTFVYKDFYIKHNNLTISHLEIMDFNAIQQNFHEAISPLHSIETYINYQNISLGISSPNRHQQMRQKNYDWKFLFDLWFMINIMLYTSFRNVSLL